MDAKLVVAVIAVLAIAGIAYYLSTQGRGGEPEGYTCVDGSQVAVLTQCPEYTKYICADGSIVNRLEDCETCSVETVKMSLRAKSHPDDEEMRTISDAAMADFNASDDTEAVFYRDELDANLAASMISGPEYARLTTAIALYRFVRDNVTTLPGNADFNTTRDDITVLLSRTGRVDEKALLLRSLLTANGIGSKVSIYGDCPTLCACLRAPSKVFVPADLPFRRMEYFPTTHRQGAAETCILGDGMVVIDPSARYFAYGNNCSGGFLAILD